MVVVTGDGEKVVLVDPRLSLRERVLRVAGILTDEEFDEIAVPFVAAPRLTAVR